MKNVDVIIDLYKRAYYDYHGRYPRVEKSGSWIRIGGFHKAFRSKELRARTVRLRELKERRDNDTAWLNEESVWHIDLPKKITKIREVKKQNSWKDYIGEDIINMFLERLFYKCDNSAYTMEKCLKEFALSGKITEQLGASDDIEYYKNKLRNAIEINKKILKKQEESYKKIIRNKNKIISELDIKIETLRKNSILFTMEDLEEDGRFKSTVKKRKYRYKEI